MDGLQSRLENSIGMDWREIMINLTVYKFRRKINDQNCHLHRSGLQFIALPAYRAVFGLSLAR